MTIDIFSILVMSFEAKRVFIKAKDIISNKRLSLYIDINEVLECLKSWFRAGIFTQNDHFIVLCK